MAKKKSHKQLVAKAEKKVRYGPSGMRYIWLEWRRMGLWVSILHIWDGKAVFEDGPDEGKPQWIEFGGVHAITKKDLEKYQREFELEHFGEISRAHPVP